MISLSRISQEKMPGLSFLYSSIFASTSGVATLGFEPPMTPGLMEPVSWYLLRILETQPWLTRSCLEMTQGRTPAAAISMILRRTWLGRGRPLMKTPPSWLTRPCPSKPKFRKKEKILLFFHFEEKFAVHFFLTLHKIEIEHQYAISHFTVQKSYFKHNI